MTRAAVAGRVISYFEGLDPEKEPIHPNLRLYNARPTQAPFL